MGKKKQPAPADEITFEQSLQELEEIVAKLEGGQLGLAESLAAYEHGVRRLNGCYEMLAAAEQRIELVQRVNGNGQASTELFADADSPELAEKLASRSRRRSAQMDDSSSLF